MIFKQLPEFAKKLYLAFALPKIIITTAKTNKHKARLYDPETGEYLNDETMKIIEDVRSGKDKGTLYASFEDFKKAMKAIRKR